MIEEMEQGTEEWRDARAGHVTATGIAAVLTKPRKGQEYSAVRRAYMTQLLMERRTGRAMEEDRGNFFDIKRGKEMEPIIRSEYELRTGRTIRPVGFVTHPRIPWAGCSPDGYINGDGLIQVKAPRYHIQLEWLSRGVVPVDHIDQMHFELACCPGREWSDFVSGVGNKAPEEWQMFVCRLMRDEKRITEIENAVVQFNVELEDFAESLPTADGKTGLQIKLERSLELVKDGKGQLVEVPF